MKDFIDKTSTVSGTPINRANLMAIQGFVASEVVLNDDGSITETNEYGETLTTEFTDNGIVETFSGEKTIVKNTTTTENGITVTITGG